MCERSDNDVQHSDVLTRMCQVMIWIVTIRSLWRSAAHSNAYLQPQALGHPTDGLSATVEFPGWGLRNA